MSQDLVYYLLPVHNILRWVIFILLVLAIIIAATRMNSNHPFTKGQKSIGLFLMIAAHINFLIGLFQWFVSAWGLNLIRSNGFGAVMKDDAQRFWAVEHLVAMLIAVVLITLANRVSKKSYIDRIKHKRIFWFLLAALIIVLFAIPWPFREDIGRPWLRGF